MKKKLMEKEEREESGGMKLTWSNDDLKTGHIVGVGKADITSSYENINRAITHLKVIIEYQLTWNDASQFICF